MPARPSPRLRTRAQKSWRRRHSVRRDAICYRQKSAFARATTALLEATPFARRRGLFMRCRPARPRGRASTLPELEHHRPTQRALPRRRTRSGRVVSRLHRARSAPPAARWLGAKPGRWTRRGGRDWAHRVGGRALRLAMERPARGSSRGRYRRGVHTAYRAWLRCALTDTDSYLSGYDRNHFVRSRSMTRSA